MLKIFKISFPIIILTIVSLFLYRNPGHVEIYWLGYEVYASITTLLLILVLLYLFIAFIISLYVNVKKFPKVIRDIYLKLRGATPRDSIQNTFYDIAVGDSKKLFEDAEKIASNIGKSYVSDYLKAKAALFNNDTKAAKTYYKKLLNHEKGKFMGYRGLAKIAMRENDLDKALEYTHQAALIEPSAPWVMRSLLRLFIATGNIKQAQTLIDKLKAEKSMEINELKLYQKDLWKKALSMENEIPKRIKLFEKILSEYPTDKQNNLGYLSLLLELEKYSDVDSFIKKVWPISPDYLLIKKYINHIETKIDDKEKAKKLIKNIVKLCEDITKKQKDEQSVIAMAEAYIATNDLDRAYNVLKTFIDKGDKKETSSVVYQLMATLEIRMGGNLKAAESFLEKSLKLMQD